MPKHLEEGDQRCLTPVPDDERRKEDEVVGFGRRDVGKRASNRVRPEEDVGVGEEQELRRELRDGKLCGDRYRVRLAQPAGGQLCNAQHPELLRMLRLKPLHHASCRVGRAIVHCDDVAARIILCEQRLEGCGDVPLFIARRHDDGDARCIRRGGNVELRLQQIGNRRQSTHRRQRAGQPRQRDEPREDLEQQMHRGQTVSDAASGGA